MTSSPSREDVELVFALRDITQGETRDSTGAPRFRTLGLGYDLDGSCSNPGAPSKCLRDQPAVEEPGGRDVAANRAAFELIEVGGPPFRQGVNHVDNTESGTSTTLFRLSDYNGGTDDEQVVLDLFVGTLWSDAQPGGPKPVWDGHDKWRVTSPWLKPPAAGGQLNLNQPRYRSEQAYVVGGRLVAEFDSMLSGSAFLPLSRWRRVVITAEIVKHPDGTFELVRGIIAGRIEEGDLWRTISLVGNLETGELTCQNGPYVAFVQAYVCQRLDLPSTNERDDIGPCDAISIALGFNGEVAEFGEPLVVAPIVAPDCGTVDCRGRPTPVETPSD